MKNMLKGQLFIFLTNNGMDWNTFHYKVSVIVLYLNERDSFEWRDKIDKVSYYLILLFTWDNNQVFMSELLCYHDANTFAILRK